MKVNRNMTSQHIDRRAFLRGAAGTTLPLPFLNLMASPGTASQPSAAPKRFVTLFSSLGDTTAVLIAKGTLVAKRPSPPPAPASAPASVEP